MEKGHSLVVSHSFEHHTGDSTMWLISTPILREGTWGGQVPITSLPPRPTTREDLRLDGYLEYRHAAKALCIYKHLCLRDSNPVPTAPLLTTILVGRRNNI
ncbi:uncharacterized protein TNCV_1783581 [Trichonephila clavipes]|nr:uncharacterized protein TNCV_1783581 [Trichonephila clavipes]